MASLFLSRNKSTPWWPQAESAMLVHDLMRSCRQDGILPDDTVSSVTGAGTCLFHDKTNDRG
jgi:hypothetical protein